MRKVSINQQIDVTKGLLVVAMVFAHCIQLLGLNVLQSVSFLINLTCFSGFLFCFGFASWSAYLSKESIPWKLVSKTAIKCYFAFVIAASTSLIIRNNESLNVIFKVATLRKLAPYSEFFLTFSLALIVSAYFNKLTLRVTKNQVYLILFMISCMMVNLLPTMKTPVIIGQLIGGSNFYYFPLVQYSALFFLGVYTARNKGDFSILMVLFCLPSAFILLFKTETVSRFPPEYLWISSSVIAVFVAYKLSALICEKAGEWALKIVMLIGKNVITYLLLSNTMIFAIEQSAHGKGGILHVVSIFIMLMIFIYFIISVTKHKAPERSY